MTTFIFSVFSHTPVWVWAVLGALGALGLQQARNHVLSRSRVLIQPLALSALSLFGASSAFGLHPVAQGGWLVGLLLGAALNQTLGLPRQVQVLADGRFAIGGSWVPMALLMLIFWLRYIVAVALVITPSLAGQTLFAAAACALYGAASGLFGARAWRVLRQAASGAPAAAALA